jgi:AcrR family transcriptional regulator
MSEIMVAEDPRVARSRQLLTQALVSLLETMPFQSIAVSDITRQARVNRSTFYAHFVDKYDLLNYLVRRDFQETIAQHLPDPTAFCGDQITQMVRATCQFMQRFSHCTPLERQLEPVIQAQIQAALYDYLLKWLAEMNTARGNDGIAVEVRANMLSWMIFGAGMQWRTLGARMDLDRYADQITKLTRQHWLANVAAG